jgi:hypothetical protein
MFDITVIYHEMNGSSCEAAVHSHRGPTAKFMLYSLASSNQTRKFMAKTSIAAQRRVAHRREGTQPIRLPRDTGQRLKRMNIKIKREVDGPRC